MRYINLRFTYLLTLQVYCCFQCGRNRRVWIARSSGKS